MAFSAEARIATLLGNPPRLYNNKSGKTQQVEPGDAWTVGIKVKNEWTVSCTMFGKKVRCFAALYFFLLRLKEWAFVGKAMFDLSGGATEYANPQAGGRAATRIVRQICGISVASTSSVL